MTGKFGPLVGAIDQGTSSTRFLVFASSTAELLTYHQTEIKQSYPADGWCEQDPNKLLSSVNECVEKACENLKALGLDPADIKCLGITNQRETTLVWDKETGKPLHNAIVWLDLRTANTLDALNASKSQKQKDYIKSQCGLPLSTYFSSMKLKWLFDNCDAVRKATEKGTCMFGTVDTWLIWNLTGGVNGGEHVTDVTNASRTMLMNLHKLQWDKDLCAFFEIPMTILPEIKSSSEIYGYLKDGVLKGVPISGVLGDQQAALVGQSCLRSGQAKNTYGTGCFLLYNTGEEAVFSDHGLLTTVGYKFGKDKPAVYALEGSVAIAGAAVRWLRDNLGIIENSNDVEKLASTVDSTYGCYFVPAFSGLFCPYWETDARGIICGLSQLTNKAHIARAVLEAVCFQTRELLEAMNKDSGIPITSLQVDGGMTENNLLMQFQSDLIGLPVVRPSMPETTALGAAMAAGNAEGIGIWSLDERDSTSITTDTFTPTIQSEERDKRFVRWKMAIQRSKHWVKNDENVSAEQESSMIKCLPMGMYVFISFGLYLIAEISSKR